MRISHLVAAGFAAAITICTTLMAPPAAQAADGPLVIGAACPSSSGVTVAVDFTPAKDAIDVRCAQTASGASVADAFIAAGFHLDDPASFITTVDGVSAVWNDATLPAWWQLFTSTDSGTAKGKAAGDWVGSMVGMADGPVSGGQAYLLQFTPTDPATGSNLKTTPVLTLTEVTGHSTAVAEPSPYGPVDKDSSQKGARWAAAWLGQQLAAGDDVLAGPDGTTTDWGKTADAILALASAGVGGDQIAASAAKLAASGSAYVGKPGQAADKASAIAKTAFTLEVAGLDPTAFGKRDLLADLRGTIADDGAIGTNPMSFSQAWGILALARSGAGAPAVTWLQSQQCASGAAAGAYGWSSSCESADQDMTALAAQALLAAGVPASDPSVKTAIAWLTGQQGKDGAVSSSMGGPNVNSSALTAQLLRAVADDSADVPVPGFILGLQISCGDIAGDLTPDAVGAVAYDQAGFDDAREYGIDDTSLDQFQRATTQAILGLGGPAMGQLTADGADAALPTAACAQKPTPTPTPTKSATPTPVPVPSPTATPTGHYIDTGGTTTGTPWSPVAAALAALVLALIVGGVAWKARHAC